jgi:hypothetical protein
MKFRIILLVVSLSCFTGSIYGQKPQKTGKDIKSSSYTPDQVSALLGRPGMPGGVISKRLFDSLLRQGLSASDSLGNRYKVAGFTFSYGERNLYEDSSGNLMVLTDYIMEYCPGDTLSTALTNNIYYKTKPGDTAYFDNIKVIVPGKLMASRSMRFVLTK